MTADKLAYGFTVPEDEYFQKAMRYFVRGKEAHRKVQFIVTTDNQIWTQQHVQLSPELVNSSDARLVFTDGHSAGFDMAMLASCDALIMSTGSFGWWAGWLANKTVIYYQNWPRAGSQLSKSFVKDDYFPPDWIAM